MILIRPAPSPCQRRGERSPASATLAGNTPTYPLGRSAAPRWAGIVIASLLFAAVHAGWMAPPIFVLSLCVGYAYERTGNLWTAIVMHATFNITSTLIFLKMGGARHARHGWHSCRPSLTRCHARADRE